MPLPQLPLQDLAARVLREAVGQHDVLRPLVAGQVLPHVGLDTLNVDVSADPRLADRVADNLFSPTKFEGTESESLVIGRGFGIVPSIEQGPDGALYAVSLTDNVIYRISRVAPTGAHKKEAMK